MVLPAGIVFAQEDPATLKLKREELQKELFEIQDQLNKVKGETKTLEREISKLNLEIKELNLGIKEADIAVKEINIVIREKEATLEEIENGISQKRDNLKAALRQIYELDQTSAIEILVAFGSIAEFFDNLKTAETIQKSIFNSLGEIKKLKEDEEKNIDLLQNDLADQNRLKKIQQINLGTVREKEKEKKVIASSKKGEEAALQARLEETQGALSEIQRYFSSLVLKGAKVSREDIINFAKEASSRTGVRPAYLLAALEVESKLGENVGKGDWKKDMKADQRETFLALTKKLNLDPDEVPVSKKPGYGWGGAMGPAQFLPKTWLAYEEEIAKLTGSNLPNPWNMRDALFAMALFLAKRGADDQSREKAASRAYISGNPNCSSYTCSSYANQIQKKAISWQEYLNQNP